MRNRISFFSLPRAERYEYRERRIVQLEKGFVVPEFIPPFYRGGEGGGEKVEKRKRKRKHAEDPREDARREPINITWISAAVENGGGSSLRRIISIITSRKLARIGRAGHRDSNCALVIIINNNGGY